MTIESKLAYLEGTKAAIRSAIITQGVAVPPETTFRDYAAKVALIEGGGSGGIDIRSQSSWGPYATATSQTVTPTDITINEGDLIVLTCYSRGKVTWPAGFSEIGESVIVGTLLSRTGVAAKIADGTETSFTVNIDKSERVCLNVTVWRASVPLQLKGYYTWLDAQSGESDFQYTLTGIDSPEFVGEGRLVLTVCTSLAATSGNYYTNAPPMNWTPLHNTYGTSDNHQNRMAIASFPVKSEEILSAKCDVCAMSNKDGLACATYLICAA